jgi:hypothetical protein
MTDPPRTKSEAELAIKYNSRLHELHQRFFRNLKTALGFIALAGAGGAIPAAMVAIPGAVTACGLIVAVAAFADVLGRYTERAAEHGLWRIRYGDLESKVAPMSLEEVDAEHH